MVVSQSPANAPATPHLAIIGAGALGCVYGVRLAAVRGSITFVVRPERVHDTEAMILEHAGSAERHSLQHPTLASAIPASASVVALAVRADNLDESLAALLDAGPPVPVLSLTPLMPESLRRLRAFTRDRVVVAMPGVVAYRTPGGVVRYWLPRAAPTLLDDSAKHDPAVRALLAWLREAGIPSRFEHRVDALNPATTMRFLPLVLLLDAAGGTAERALSNRSLLELAIAAVTECRNLASLIGPEPAWSRLLGGFVGPRSLRMGVALARRLSAEAVHFVEQHFGSKTHTQNLVLAREVVALGAERGVKMEALVELVRRSDRKGTADA